MKDPIDKMRKAFEEAQSIIGLKQFAQKNEEKLLEKNWIEFINKAISPAFAKVKRDIFEEKFTDLPERPSDPGFKVQDFPNTEFWFWIELRGRKPAAQARRKYGKSSGAFVVLTPLFSSKPEFELTDVTEDDVLSAVAGAYENSFFKM